MGARFVSESIIAVVVVGDNVSAAWVGVGLTAVTLGVLMTAFCVDMAVSVGDTFTVGAELVGVTGS